MISIVNIINKIFDLIFVPFAGLNPLWGISVISLATGVVMLVIFSYISDQQGIKDAKDKIKAYLLEVRLFKHDLQQMLKSQKQILRYNFTYMKYSVLPMLVMIIPVIFIMVQLDNRYSMRPLNAGEKTLLSLKLADGESLNNTNVELKLPPGISLDAPPLRIESEDEIDWRLKIDNPGEYEIQFTVGSETISKRLVAKPIRTRLASVTEQAAFSQLLITPGESPIPSDSSVKEISIVYPEMHLKVFGWNVHWLVLFFVLSIASAFALKDVFKVHI